MNQPDWDRIERLMHRSFTGGKLTDTEQAELQAAFRWDRDRYAALHQTVVTAEVTARQRMFR
jgi:hypothetical protein